MLVYHLTVFKMAPNGSFDYCKLASDGVEDIHNLVEYQEESREEIRESRRDSS